MNDTSDLGIFENELFTVDHSSSCVVPGYVVVRLKVPSTSLSDLAPVTAQALGQLLSRVVRAIEVTVGADRVYCLSLQPCWRLASSPGCGVGRVEEGQRGAEWEVI